MNVNSKINQSNQATAYEPDTHPLTLLDGATNPWHLIWKLSNEPLRNFFSPYCVITANGKLKPKGHSGEFNRLKNKCELIDELRDWYDTVQRELIPLVEHYFNERNSAMIERFHEENEQRKAALSNKLQRMDSIIHELELKGPRLLKYVAIMALYRKDARFSPKHYRLMAVRLEYVVGLTVRVAENEPGAYDELCDMLQVMDTVTQAALKGYVLGGGWGRDENKVVRLWPAVQEEPSVLTVGTGF